MKKMCRCKLCSAHGCKCASYSELFSVLGNSNRLYIINALRARSMNVSEISVCTGLEQSCVSHCLRLLENQGFVASSSEGKYRVYALSEELIEPLMDLIDQLAQKNVEVVQ